jgi:hypothetical protein
VTSVYWRHGFRSAARHGFRSAFTNWRGSPLRSLEIIINLIGSTRTEEGLRIEAELDTNNYPKGIEVSDDEMAKLKIKRDEFHGDWNYTISPRQQ